MIVPPEVPENPIGPEKYRFKRGSKLADMPPLPPQVPVPPLSSLDGPFQLAEYLALKVRADPHNVQALVDAPADITKASERHVWVYEHLRRIPIDVTPLITQLLQLCNRETCPEMKADEWQYLCVAHGGEGTDRCCAIDYILHTLDSTSSLLNSSKYFPSRLQIPDSSLSHFPSLFRRLSRIFSHAYFHHREVFATSEAETSLYRRFVALCHKYELVGPSLLIIPTEGYEGIVMADEDDDMEMDSRDTGDHDSDEENDDDEEDEGNNDAEQESRGRETDESGRTARSHSLGRHTSMSPTKWSASPMQPATKSKPAPAQESTTQSPPSIRAQLDMTEPVIPTTVQGRGTLSRGKGSRGTTANVWAQPAAASDTPATVPEDVPASVIGMARKESVDSVVYAPSTDEEQPQEQQQQQQSTSPPLRRTPSPTKSPLKVDTVTLPSTDEKETPTTGDTSMVPTPVPTESPSLPIPSKADTTTDEPNLGVFENDSSNNNKTSVLGSSPSKSPSKDFTIAVPSSSKSPSQLTASRPEVLVSPKSELLPLASPKSELLSVSPKQSPSSKRGGRGSTRGAKPKSPTKSKSKSSSPSQSPSPPSKLSGDEHE